MRVRRSSCLLFLCIGALSLCLCCPAALIGGSGLVIAVMPALPPSLVIELAGMEHQGTVDQFWARVVVPTPEFSVTSMQETHLEFVFGSASHGSDTILPETHPVYDFLSTGIHNGSPVVVYAASETEANLVCGWEGDYCSGKVYDVDFKPGGIILYEVNASGVTENSGVILFVHGNEVSFGGLVVEGQVYTGSDSYLATIWDTSIADLNEDLSHLFIQVDGKKLGLKDTVITEREIFVVFQ